MNNKGISDVVSTVLIILLVVAAVAIIGAIIINTVSKTAPQVDLGVACATLDLKPVKCVLNANGVAPSVSNGTWVRNAGGSDITVTKVTAIYQDASGVSLETVDSGLTVTQLKDTFSSRVIKGTTASDDIAGSKFTVSATVQSSDGGATKVCDAALPVVCS